MAVMVIVSEEQVPEEAARAVSAAMMEPPVPVALEATEVHLMRV